MVTLTLIYDTVDFGTLGFYMGKCLISGFLRNYISLRYNTWYTWSTKWANERYYVTKGQGHSVSPSVIKIFKHLQLWNHWADWSQNFIWSLSGVGKQKLIPRVWVTWPRWPPCPYMVKTLQKSSSLEPKGLWPWNLVWSIGHAGPS